MLVLGKQGWPSSLWRRSKSFLVVACLLCLGTFKGASADCMGECMRDRGCEAEYVAGTVYESAGACMMYKNFCDAKCRGANAAFGAVAYDKLSGAWGLSDSSPDKQTAAQSALTYCGQQGQDCDVVDSFSNVCAAVATGTNNVVAWAEEATAPAAQALAKESCAEKYGAGCEVQVSHCYFP